MSEFRNVLMFHHRQGLVPLGICKEALSRARQAVPPERTRDVEDGLLFNLSVRSGCSGYDCEFVAVAEKLGVPLLTWDKGLLRRFPKRAVKPEDYLKA